MASKRISRRRMLQVSASAAGYFLTAGSSPAQQRQNDPMRKLNIALIGAGGRAEGNLNGVKNENIVALCDVDDRRARKSFNDYPNVPKYKDFRVMLEKQKDIEAVVVSTPDHMHAHASIMAMKLGKHCYCEKPLTHSVWEARQMKLVAQNAKVATQMGNQGTSDHKKEEPGLRAIAEILRAGTIGDVRELHVWTNRPIWKQNINRPTDRIDVPAELDWDLWLGCAPSRPYHSAYVPFAWRGWWDFGTGALGDMGCHTMNLAFMGLKLGAPISVEADLATPLNADSGPEGCTVTLEFPARENFPACKLFWYERRKPADSVMQGEKPTASGSLFVGSKGTLYSPSDYGTAYKLLPDKNFEGFRPPEPSIPRSPGHHAEWIRACKGGPAAMSNFVDYSALLTETVLIGNVAMRVGKKFTWDTAKLQATDCPEAAQYIRREYRKGWELNP